MNCPNCSASKIVKYGQTHYGKQRFQCRECGRQFVEDASRQPISSETRELVDRCLDERLSLAAICRITIENHIGAIWCFVHHYNASLQT